MREITRKFKEVIMAVVPITLIVLLLSVTITPLETSMIFRFLIGSLFVIVGLAVFLIGVDIGITPIGKNMGSVIVKRNKIWIVIAAGLMLGFFISIAEPDLHILAGRVELVTSGMITKFSIVGIVSVGVAVLLALGLTRIVYNIPLNIFFTVIYGSILILALFTTPEFLAISFDACGATTGALTVPFVLALALGVSVLKKDSKASENDSFGLVGIISSGAIIAVMVMSLFIKTEDLVGVVGDNAATSGAIFMPFLHIVPKIALEVLVALLPILLTFIFFQILYFKMPKRTFIGVLSGMTFTFIGLIVFLAGVNAGFMDAAGLIGHEMAMLGNKTYVIVLGFALGAVTILVEPAVHVLTRQIEDVTSGYVKRRLVMLALTVGVGAAVALSMLRIVEPSVQLWHYLLPAYILCIGLSYVTPPLFVGIAFDSGGVASGPMTATFILAFSQGVAQATESADLLVDGFGTIAMVATTPIIALQLLGLLFTLQSKRRKRREAKKNG